MKTTKKMIGFTLVEMLLVMVIVAMVIAGIATYSQQRVMQMRQDKTVLQIQQILNAGLAYYVNTSTWPTSLSNDLQNKSYLPGPSGSVQIVNPWSGNYVIGHSASPNTLFAVCTPITAGNATAAITQVLAGRLPMAYITDGDRSADCTPSDDTEKKEMTNGLPTASVCRGSTCTIVATVNIPGQNLNNARSVNFAGNYHHGACVAAPKCPAKMVPSIAVAPVSVSGMNDDPTSIYPISSFTAYTSDPLPMIAEDVPACPNDTTPADCPTVGGENDKYWRVCLQIFTQRGLVKYTGPEGDTSTGDKATTILAITRCAPPGEDEEETISGSPFTVFSY